MTTWIVYIVTGILAYRYLLNQEKNPNRAILASLAGLIASTHWLAAVVVIGSIVVVTFLKNNKDNYENQSGKDANKRAH